MGTTAVHFLLVDDATENVEANVNFLLLYITYILFGCLKVLFFMCETQGLPAVVFLIYLRQDLIKWLRLLSDSKTSSQFSKVAGTIYEDL